jgi:hypothetical protein
LRDAVEGRSFFRGIGKFGERPHWKERRHGVRAKPNWQRQSHGQGEAVRLYFTFENSVTFPVICTSVFLCLHPGLSLVCTVSRPIHL